MFCPLSPLQGKKSPDRSKWSLVPLHLYSFLISRHKAHLHKRFLMWLLSHFPVQLFIICDFSAFQVRYLLEVPKICCQVVSSFEHIRDLSKLPPVYTCDFHHKLECNKNSTEKRNKYCYINGMCKPAFSSPSLNLSYLHLVKEKVLCLVFCMISTCTLSLWSVSGWMLVHLVQWGLELGLLLLLLY